MDGGNEDDGEVRRARIVAGVIGLGWGAPMFGWALVASGVLAAAAVLIWVVPLAMLIGIYAVERARRIRNPWLRDRQALDLVSLEPQPTTIAS